MPRLIIFPRFVKDCTYEFSHLLYCFNCHVVYILQLMHYILSTRLLWIWNLQNSSKCLRLLDAKSTQHIFLRTASCKYQLIKPWPKFVPSPKQRKSTPPNVGCDSPRFNTVMKQLFFLICSILKCIYWTYEI